MRKLLCKYVVNFFTNDKTISGEIIKSRQILSFVLGRHNYLYLFVNILYIIGRNEIESEFVFCKQSLNEVFPFRETIVWAVSVS